MLGLPMMVRECIHKSMDARVNVVTTNINFALFKQVKSVLICRMESNS